MDRMSLLPTIKCSSCGVDIEILHLADHVCLTASPSATALPAPTLPAPPKLERAATFGGPSFSNRSDRQVPSGRMPPPPRIDPNAANQPFRPLEPLPIGKHNESRNRAPRSAVPPKSPFKMNRSVTTPLPRSMAPPSPDFPGNMDCAFPPFPNKSATPKSAKTPKRDRLEPTYQPRYAEPSPLFAPLSPRTNGGQNVTKRMDTIAPGPFDGRADRRPSTSSSSRSPVQDVSTLGHRRTRTQDSTRSNESIQKQRVSLTSNASRSSSYSGRSMGLPARPKPGMSGTNGPSPPPLPPASEQTEGIDAFLDRLQKETMKPSRAGSDDASRTNPVRQGSEGKREPPPRPRRPSECDLPPNDVVETKSTGYAAYSNNMLPSRNASRSGSETEVPQEPVPPRSLQPPPSIAPTLGNDTPSNPLHTPSDSGLSDDSYGSFRSAASSRSSPPGSVAGHSRDVSKISRSDYIPEETVERTASPESYAESRPTRGVGSYVRPNGPQPIPRALSPGYSNMPESPMDPAIQMGASIDRQLGDLLPSKSENNPPRRMPASQLKQPEVRRPKTASKGDCRGCSEPITGKSVKDSSGRLTGRYHKQCFVCRTCGDAFPTAEFYVFENFPYCEQHYHKLNGSLCNSCDRGIEGQYVETDTRKKFHPRCLTCATCRIVLRDDYFEVGGQKYCDRHGQRAAAPQHNYLGPGGYKPRNVQKRRTRLMMMA
ncbi:Nn.00g102090.m01.CDS01 [Neocucurbitaria sp. VM-36]